MVASVQFIRDEMIGWQNRRITLVGVSTALVPAVLSVDSLTISSSGALAFILTSVLLFYLSAAGFLMWYCRAREQKLAAYILVEHADTAEAKYEKNLADPQWCRSVEP